MQAILRKYQPGVALSRKDISLGVKLQKQLAADKDGHAAKFCPSEVAYVISDSISMALRGVITSMNTEAKGTPRPQAQARMCSVHSGELHVRDARHTPARRTAAGRSRKNGARSHPAAATGAGRSWGGFRYLFLPRWVDPKVGMMTS